MPPREQQRPPRWQWDPSISVGSLLQVATMLLVGGVIYGSLKTDQVAIRAEAVVQKEQNKEDKQATNEALKEIRSDMKSMQQTLGEMKVSLSAIQAVQQQRTIKESK